MFGSQASPNQPSAKRRTLWAASFDSMTGHVLSVTSATVPPDSEAAIVEAYRAVTTQLPHMVLHTSLARGEGNEWSIVTLWRSRDQLEEYRRSVPTPAAIKIFQDAGAQPTVAVLEVVHEVATQ